MRGSSDTTPHCAAFCQAAWVLTPSDTQYPLVLLWSHRHSSWERYAITYKIIGCMTMYVSTTVKSLLLNGPSYSYNLFPCSYSGFETKKTIQMVTNVWCASFDCRIQMRSWCRTYKSVSVEISILNSLNLLLTDLLKGIPIFETLTVVLT
jgi:hypothetical protein